jgi:hypothetical protein
VRTRFTTLEEAGVADPDALARQLHLLYDGAGLSARMDHDPSAPSMAAAVLAETGRSLLGVAASR